MAMIVDDQFIRSLTKHYLNQEFSQPNKYFFQESANSASGLHTLNDVDVLLKDMDLSPPEGLKGVDALIAAGIDVIELALTGTTSYDDNENHALRWMLFEDG
jgi:hypothetical protein